MSDAYRVVVGMDLEEDGDVALRCALTIAARARGVEIHAVYVIPPRQENVAILSRALEGGLEALRDRVLVVCGAEPTAESIRLHVRLGEIVPTLQQVAVDYDADLMVVGTHGRTGARKLVLGSVAAELTKAARMPVLVARDKKFEGLARTPPIPPATPGAELHHDQCLTDVIHPGNRASHISGMI